MLSENKTNTDSDDFTLVMTEGKDTNTNATYKSMSTLNLQKQLYKN